MTHDDIDPIWTERRSGKSNQRGLLDKRDPFERDRTRAIHSSAFRRLQGKTQILGTKEGDFHRTRLTHSLEVASIGQSIVRKLAQDPAPQGASLAALLPSDDLIHVICLLHDLGHPPFGHGGETALNFMMHDYGGFEANGQTLRVLTKLEGSYGSFGLDLTRRTLLGILKYPVNYTKALAPLSPLIPDLGHTNKPLRINDWLPPKAYFDCDQPEIDWLLSPFSSHDVALFQSLSQEPKGNQHGRASYQSFDCSIMNIADDIAYGVHDLEDAIHLHLIKQDQLDTKELQQLLASTGRLNSSEKLIDKLFSAEASKRKQAIGEIVNYFISTTSIVSANDAFENPQLRYHLALEPEAQALLKYLMDAIFQHVIDSQEARTFEFGGQTVIRRLFEAFSSNPNNLLDKKNRLLFSQAPDANLAFRVVSDYIASMTDDYAYRIHERLFGFNTRTIFERL